MVKISEHRKKYEKPVVVPVCLDCDCTLCSSSIIEANTIQSTGQEIGEEVEMWADAGFNHTWE